jgi:hypothetical protein
LVADSSNLCVPMELAGGSSQSQIPLCMPLWVYASGCSLDYVIYYHTTKRIQKQDHIVFWPYSYTEGGR